MKKLFVMMVTIIAMLSLTACSDKPEESMEDISNVETVEAYGDEENTLIMYLTFEDKYLVSFDGYDEDGYWLYTFVDDEGHRGYGQAWPSYVIGMAKSYGYDPQ